jgi:hypothetical protein
MDPPQAWPMNLDLGAMDTTQSFQQDPQDGIDGSNGVNGSFMSNGGATNVNGGML